MGKNDHGNENGILSLCDEIDRLAREVKKHAEIIRDESERMCQVSGYASLAAMEDERNDFQRILDCLTVLKEKGILHDDVQSALEEKLRKR